MSERRPLVLDDGFISELPQGDTLSSSFSTSVQVVAGSGLSASGIMVLKTL
jgi:hypothetical protein